MLTSYYLPVSLSLSSPISMASHFTTLSCASTNQILKFNLSKHFFNIKCPNLTSPYALLDKSLSASFLVESSIKLQAPDIITGRLLHKNTSLVAGSRSLSSKASAKGDNDTDSGNTLDADGNSGDVIEDNANDIEVEIEKTGKNSRKIRSKVVVQASLQTVWNLLTNYEGLADFIPSLAVSQVIEKKEKFARLFQIGQQDLAFGLKFNAKGTVDCFEKDLQILPFCQKRDIEFNMIEGDFQQFEGKWSVEQGVNCNTYGDIDSVKELQTTLSYVVDVKPKLWLPVGLVEGRLCKEIRMNLSCIRGAAERTFQNSNDSSL